MTFAVINYNNSVHSVTQQTPHQRSLRACKYHTISKMARLSINQNKEKLSLMKTKRYQNPKQMNQSQAKTRSKFIQTQSIKNKNATFQTRTCT